MKKLQLPNGREKMLVRPENIIRVQGHSNYCKIFFADNSKPLLVSKVLLWMQESLPADMFARVHRSHLVNKLHVIQIQGSHSKRLLLANGETIGVSRRKMGLAKKEHMMVA